MYSFSLTITTIMYHESSSLSILNVYNTMSCPGGTAVVRLLAALHDGINKYFCTFGDLKISDDSFKLLAVAITTPCLGPVVNYSCDYFGLCLNAGVFGKSLEHFI